MSVKELQEQIESLEREGSRKGRWTGVEVKERILGKGCEAGCVVTLQNYLVPKDYRKEKEYLWEPLDRTDLFIVVPPGYPYLQISDFWTRDIFLLVETHDRPYYTGQAGPKEAVYWNVPVGSQFWRWKLQTWRPSDTLVVYEKVIRNRFLAGC